MVEKPGLDQLDSMNSYFTSLLSSLEIDPQILKKVDSMLEYHRERAFETAFIAPASKNKNSKIEAKIKEDKIKSVFSLKQSLKQKLQEVDRQLEELKDPGVQNKTPLDLSPETELPNYKPLIAKLEAEKAEILRKKKKIKEKLTKMALEKAEQAKALEKQEKDQKKQEIENRIKSNKEKIQRRKSELTRKEAEYKQKLENEKFYEKMEKKFENNKAREEKKMKEKLDKIKQFYKPISNKELQDFEAKFLSIQSEKGRKRMEKLSLNKAFVKDREEEIKERFSSNILKRLEEMRKQELAKSQEKQMLSLNRALKHKEFFEEVKKKHKPKVDNKLKLEIEILKENLGEKNNLRYYMSEANIEDTPQKSAYQLGLEYLQGLKAKVAKSLERTSNPRALTEVDKTNANLSFPEPLQNHEGNEDRADMDLERILPAIQNGSEKQIPPETTPAKSLETKSVELQKWAPSNYLKEVTEKLKLSKGTDYWRKIEKKQNLSALEKLERLRQEAETLEKKAQMKEKVLKAQRQKDFDLKLEENNRDIDDLLLNSIQAKLRVLEN